MFLTIAEGGAKGQAHQRAQPRECCAGGWPFKIDRSNYRAALRCQKKYACPALRAAAERWMVCRTRDLARNASLWELQQLLQTANEFSVDGVRMACLEIVVLGFSDIVRCVALQTLRCFLDHADSVCILASM